MEINIEKDKQLRLELLNVIEKLITHIGRELGCNTERAKVVSILIDTYLRWRSSE